MIDVASAVKSAEELDKLVGIIGKSVAKLKANPDLAAQKLEQALGEVAKTLQVVDNAASQFLSLGIDDGALTKDSKLLLSIGAGNLSAEVEHGRGHCHVIRDIYSKYLDKWFSRAFSPNEYPSIKFAFQELAFLDLNLFKELGKVAGTLETEASAVLDLVFKGEEANARTRVRSAFSVLGPLRKTIWRTMQALYSIRTDLLDTMRAVV